jgi:hypothetical protein
MLLIMTMVLKFLIDERHIINLHQLMKQMYLLQRRNIDYMKKNVFIYNQLINVVNMFEEFYLMLS